MPATLAAEPYHPAGGARALMFCREPEVLIEGPAGTGKTRAVVEFCHFWMARKPGARCLWTRQTLKSLRESVLVTFERDVYVRDRDAFTDSEATRHNRITYVYRNGSEIVLHGLDTPTRTFSFEFDIVVVFEAIEVQLATWEFLQRSLRNNVLHFQQIIADTNPGPAGHWLDKRADTDKMERILSRHGDNPTITQAYLKRLEGLTGARRARMYLGMWVSEEGQVWEQYDPAIHCVDMADVPELVWYFGSFDWGYRAPSCMQVWGVDADRNTYRVVEIYKQLKTRDWWRHRWLELYEQYKLVHIVWAHEDRESRDVMNTMLGEMGAPSIVKGPDLSSHGTQEGAKQLGLDMVRQLLKPADGGKPRLFLVKDALREGRDEVLVDAGRAWCLEQEIPSYVLMKDIDGKPRRGLDERTDPDCDDHACDAMRYAMTYLWRHGLSEYEPGAPEFEGGTLGDLLGHTEMWEKSTR